MKDDKLHSPARVALTAYLKAKKMRRTPERYAILEKIFSTDEHFYVDDLHKNLEAEGYHVSLSTVYATIQLFVEAGLVRRHQFGNQPAQYERVPQGINESHHHLVCNHCGRVRAVRDQEVISMIGNLRYPTFKTEFFSLYVYGICSRCQKKLKKEKEKEQAVAKTKKKKTKP
ncbi:MAG: transcriptional repressor [Muribaculaceae bacterium]|nr:transcriptional repressor [Muribaculaceae bacterium]